MVFFIFLLSLSREHFRVLNHIKRTQFNLIDEPKLFYYFHMKQNDFNSFRKFKLYVSGINCRKVCFYFSFDYLFISMYAEFLLCCFLYFYSEFKFTTLYIANLQLTLLREKVNLLIGSVVSLVPFHIERVRERNCGKWARLHTLHFRK